MKLSVGRAAAAILVGLVCIAGVLYTTWGIYNYSGFIRSNRDAEPDDFVFIENLEKQSLEALDADKASPALDHSKLRIVASGKTKVNATIARLYLIKTTERRLSTSQSEQLRLDQELENLLSLMVYPRVDEAGSFGLLTFVAFLLLAAVLWVE
ncbi:MAG: hypothetical protein E6R03_10140 [Hyphomicrobiaceae bacterium]|nr:MAG: hypothetical protein E6R03_10140 [Hyphomicrobiaceae bacterium]